MPSCPSTRAALVPLATPRERRRLAIPPTGSGLEPGDDLRGRRGLLAIEGAALENTLDRFRHVQPRSAQGSIERHDAVREQPADKVTGIVPGQIVQDQEHAEWRWFLWYGDAHAQPVLPA